MNGVVRTDKMFATDNRAGLVSVRYQSSGVEADIDNGNVVKLDGLETGSREIYKGVTPSKSDSIGDIVLIASPEMMYESGKYDITKFVNKAGAISRGYRLHKGDIFSLTVEALTATNPSVGDIVELDDAKKLKVVASATNGSTKIGSIIDKNVTNRLTYYVVEVE